MKIKHSKYKNTGILFELLVRQITSDTLEGKDSPVNDLLQKYFVKTELGKEYKLYETLLNRTSLTETKADITITTLLESSKTSFSAICDLIGAAVKCSKIVILFEIIYCGDDGLVEF